MSKREVIANGKKQQQKKNSTNQMVWSSIQAHWPEKKAAMVANYNDVGQKRGEDLHFSMQTTQSSHGSTQLTRTRQTKPKEPHKKKKRTARPFKTCRKTLYHSLKLTDGTEQSEELSPVKSGKQTKLRSALSGEVVQPRVLRK